jgi:hypothetical protein
MFQRFSQRPENLEYLGRIEAWTRARFGLVPDQIVLVTEESSGVPGFPACDTTVRFWTGTGARYRMRIFKPVRDVTGADLPPAWLMPSLLDDGAPDCC